METRASAEMNGARTELQNCPSSPALPAEHVLTSGAVIFPGVFDQYGCPLVVFPSENQCKLLEELSGDEVVRFIHYCLRLHSIRVEETLVSVVVDLRKADVGVARFIADTLLLLEIHRRTVHSVYVVKPKKKDVLKQLEKRLSPSGSRQHRGVLFKRFFLREVYELSNYIDRSQLISSLGGYLIYCHQSWVSFVRVVDVFVQQFLTVVNRLPSCISTLQSLSKQPVPSELERLQRFCSVNEAQFQQLRRDLGLDELLKHCECLLEKFRFPENDACFHAMAGTLLFTHTALEMLHNYNRITAAVEKVELLWKQAFTKAHMQLQILRLQRDAQQIEEQMLELMRMKVEPYRTEVARDAHRAEELQLQFHTSVYTHAMALVRRAEDVIHTLAETVPLSERTPVEPWLDDLSRLKEKLSSAVQHQLHTLRRVLDFHHACDRLKLWYGQVLSESLLQELLWTGHCEGDTGCSWRPRVESFTRRSPCPQVEELVKLAQLSNAMTEASLQTTGTQLAHRCMTLRRILTAPGAVPIQDLQLALQWQYEYLKGHRSTSDLITPDPPGSTQFESLIDLSKWPSVSSTRPAAKPASLSSFDSGFDGAGGSLLDLRSRREMPGYLGNGDTALKWSPLHGQIHEEIVVSVSDSEDQHEEPGFGLKRDAAHASIQIVPKISLDSVNLEIKVKRSATLPSNPWLSLPIEELESCYTVSITPGSSSITRSPSLSERWQDQHTHEESLQESGLSPAANVLSSTLTDPEDRPVDGDPSLQWDTFDLHNIRRDSLERLDVSVGDWLQREQDQLEEVQETLERAAGIIQEEEEVLAQEVALDELLRSEDLHRHWPQWTEGQQCSVVCSGDLSESSVIGLDVDVLDSSEGVTSCERPAQPDSECPHVDRSGILQELEDLQLLEEQIMEECLKLEELRRSEMGKPRVIMEKSSKWREEDEELLSSPEPADTEKTDSPDVLNADESSESSQSELTALVSCSELLQHSPSHHTEPLNSLSGSSTLSQTLEDVDSNLAETARPSVGESSSCGAAVELQVCDAPSTLQNSDVRSEFDPGGIPNPAPWRTFPFTDQHCPPSASEYTHKQGLEESGSSISTSELSDVEESAQSQAPGLHMQNNNNNTAVEQQTEETQTPAHCPDSSRTEPMAGGFMRGCSSALQQQINTPSRQMSDYKTPIILDSGSGLMKAGFADQDLPAAVFPSVIGRPKYEEVMSSCVDRELYVGHDAQHMRGVLTLRYPIRHGVVTNWDEMEKIWSHAFQLLSAAPEDHPVLLTEAALNPLQNRQRMVELMFEAFGVPLTFVAVQAVLALYASGRTTGVVLDSGDGVSHSVPVFEGYCLPHAIQRLDLAGADVTLQLQKLLLERAVCLRTSAELEIVREMKERCCFVSLDYEAELKSSGSEAHYTLPDGRIVSLANERFRAPEILFRPELIGRDHYGLHESVFRSVLQSDLDLRRSFVGNILLSGGNTLLSGLAERLQLEIRRMVPADLSTCVRVTSPPERDFSVWSGGAALANLPEHQSAWISAAEYEEFGPQIVFRKCF